MCFCHQPIITWPGAAEACSCPAENPGGCILAEAPAAYKPRHPERTGFYHLFESHFDSYVRAYEERFEARSGPLRPVVVRSAEAFLDRGRLQGGFARIRCPQCRAEHLLASSCRTRNFCSSCQAKRAVLFAEKLTTQILAPVPHRHWTFSIPRVLRGLVERDRKLLGLLSQTAYAAILKTFQALFERTDVRPGCVVSLQTFGYAGNWNPHAHALVSDGVFSPQGEFLPLPALDAAAVMEVFRRMLLQRLHQAERLSESFMHNLLSGVHPGFSLIAGPPVEAGALTSLESQASYVTRPALAMDALKKLQDGRLALETPPDPRTGATVVALDPLEWIHRITAHIPDAGRHGQRFYGAYSNRARVAISSAAGHSATGAAAKTHPEQDNSDSSTEARSTWARLLRKIFEVDPLVCACGARIKIVSLITDPPVVDRILRHRESERCRVKDPFEPRAPPRAHTQSRQ